MTISSQIVESPVNPGGFIENIDRRLEGNSLSNESLIHQFFRVDFNRQNKLEAKEFKESTPPDGNTMILTAGDYVNSFSAHYGALDQIHPLAETQRLALSAYLSADKNGPRLSLLPVNGAPGTGKTSLLRAIVGDYVVKAALNAYRDFKQQGSKDLINFPPPILCSSTNNQALFNVSEGLSKKEGSLLEQGDNNPLYHKWVNHILSVTLSDGSKSDVDEESEECEDDDAEQDVEPSIKKIDYGISQTDEKTISIDLLRYGLFVPGITKSRNERRYMGDVPVIRMAVGFLLSVAAKYKEKDWLEQSAEECVRYFSEWQKALKKENGDDVGVKGEFPEENVSMRLGKVIDILYKTLSDNVDKVKRVTRALELASWLSRYEKENLGLCRAMSNIILTNDSDFLHRMMHLIFKMRQHDSLQSDVHLISRRIEEISEQIKVLNAECVKTKKDIKANKARAHRLNSDKADIPNQVKSDRDLIARIRDEHIERIKKELKQEIRDDLELLDELYRGRLFACFLAMFGRGEYGKKRKAIIKRRDAIDSDALKKAGLAVAETLKERINQLMSQTDMEISDLENKNLILNNESSEFEEKGRMLHVPLKSLREDLADINKEIVAANLVIEEQTEKLERRYPGVHRQLSRDVDAMETFADYMSKREDMRELEKANSDLDKHERTENFFLSLRLLECIQVLNALEVCKLVKPYICPRCKSQIRRVSINDEDKSYYECENDECGARFYRTTQEKRIKREFTEDEIERLFEFGSLQVVKPPGYCGDRFV